MPAPSGNITAPIAVDIDANRKRTATVCASRWMPLPTMYAAGNRRPNSATVRSRHTAGAPSGRFLLVCLLAAVCREPARDGLPRERRPAVLAARAGGAAALARDGEGARPAGMDLRRRVRVATQRTALQRSAPCCNAVQQTRADRRRAGACALQFVADAVARAQPSVRVAALTHLLGTAWPARFKDARSRRKLEKELCAKMDEIFATKTLKEHPHERTRACTHARTHADTHARTCACARHRIRRRWCSLRTCA